MATLLSRPGYWLQTLIEFQEGFVVLATAACLCRGCEISSVELVPKNYKPLLVAPNLCISSYVNTP